MSQGLPSVKVRLVAGFAAGAGVGVAAILGLLVGLGVAGVRSFLPLVLAVSALVGFLVAYFMVPRDSVQSGGESDTQLRRAFRAVGFAGVGVQGLVAFVVSLKWEGLLFAAVAFVLAGVYARSFVGAWRR
jgi:hypothetical protein